MGGDTDAVGCGALYRGAFCAINDLGCFPPRGISQALFIRFLGGVLLLVGIRAERHFESDRRINGHRQARRIPAVRGSVSGAMFTDAKSEDPEPHLEHGSVPHPFDYPRIAGSSLVNVIRSLTAAPVSAKPASCPWESWKRA